MAVEAGVGLPVAAPAAWPRRKPSPVLLRFARSGISLAAGAMYSARRSGSPPKPPVASSVLLARIMRVAGAALDLGADDGTVLDQERWPPTEHLAALAHEAVAGEQVVRHIGGAPAPIAKHGDRFGDVHTQRADPRERLVIALDDCAVPAPDRASGLTSRMILALGAVQMNPA